MDDHTKYGMSWLEVTSDNDEEIIKELTEIEHVRIHEPPSR